MCDIIHIKESVCECVLAYALKVSLECMAGNERLHDVGAIEAVFAVGAEHAPLHLLLLLLCGAECVAACTCTCTCTHTVS